jgi:PilZ domain
MHDAFEFNEKPSLKSSKERRKNNRRACSIEANYMVQGRWNRGSIQNISNGGAYIRTFRSRTFSPGEGVFLVARIRVLREQLRGKIVWVGPNGMGVEFQSTECV